MVFWQEKTLEEMSPEEWEALLLSAKVGIAASGSPRELSICAHALGTREPLVVLDALEDVRFADNPMVCGAPFIRFYAGARLTTPTGFQLGVISVFGPEPRRLVHILFSENP